MRADLSHQNGSQLKIAFIITCLEVGGAENQVIDLAEALFVRGHEVLVISMSGDPEVLPRHAEVRVEALHMTKSPAGLLIAYWDVCRLLRRFRPDVVHSHMIHANLFARMLRLAAPIPRLVCTAHSVNEGGWVRMGMYRWSDRMAEVTTNVSRVAVERYIACAAVPRHKALVAYNGIDCERFRFDPVGRAKVRNELGVTPDTVVLLAAGKLCDAKDYPNLLNAFATVAARRSDCVLWIAGAGPEHGHIQALADTIACDGRIKLLGLRRDMDALMSAADVFVLSSAWEGFPLVIGEAMACERVIVATDAGGVPEWLGSCGYTVRARDSIVLADAMLQALELNGDERRSQGLVARKRVREHYSLEAAVQRWERIYCGSINPEQCHSQLGNK